MASDLIVVMGASEVYGYMPRYLSDLAAAGIDTHVVDSRDKPDMNSGGNLGYRVRVFRKIAQQFDQYEKIVISDAFDVFFFGSKEEVIKKIPTTHLLHAAEKNCYPEECKSLPIPDCGPWRYANGGLVAGTPENFIRWCNDVERHARYRERCLDQQFLNELVAENSPLCTLDSETKLFFCLYGGYAELDFASGLPLNSTYCSWPNFVHANGKWDPRAMLARYERSLNESGFNPDPQLS